MAKMLVGSGDASGRLFFGYQATWTGNGSFNYTSVKCISYKFIGAMPFQDGYKVSITV